MEKINLLENLPDALAKERLDTLVGRDGVRIERIVSQGQCSANDFWYDQEPNEWVVLLKEYAALEFEGQDLLIEMHPGDALDIPTHRSHRVACLALLRRINALFPKVQGY